MDENFHTEQTWSRISIHVDDCFWPPKELYDQYSIIFSFVLVLTLERNICLLSCHVKQLVANWPLFGMQVTYSFKAVVVFFKGLLWIEIDKIRAE